MAILRHVCVYIILYLFNINNKRAGNIISVTMYTVCIVTFINYTVYSIPIVLLVDDIIWSIYVFIFSNSLWLCVILCLGSLECKVLEAKPCIVLHLSLIMANAWLTNMYLILWYFVVSQSKFWVSCFIFIVIHWCQHALCSNLADIFIENIVIYYMALYW